MFDTVLIANRGEIACRVIRTLRSLGIRSVAVYSDADAGARHVAEADLAVRLGPAAAAESYLNIDAVIAAAKQTAAQAIHPGYGFLAENTTFAKACADNGIVFIGPSAEAISVMGDKISAKKAVGERDVPTVPGIAEPGLSDDQLAAGVPQVGYPVLIKPSAGGGGKGMHVVESEAELRPALAAARREAAASFGDDTLFVERYVENPRHIEVQVLADDFGTVVHLGERECSLQRRHQKVIEEAPSPLLDPATRERIGEAACATARSVGYRGAGTVEFIVSADRPDEFFFMEMNTRLQVEHPVTEEITGIDLVEQQLRIAAGETLALKQSEIVLDGHAFEARLYAEDPAAGFLPTGGLITGIVEPTGAGIRVDSALRDGLAVSVDYDPMLAKIISWGPDRDEARARLEAALENTAVFGIGTNLEFLRLLLQDPVVRAGEMDTGLIGRILDDLPFAQPDPRHQAEAALLLAADRATAAAPWQRGDGWRLGAPAAAVCQLRTEGGDRVQVRTWGTDRVAVGDGPVQQAAVLRTGDRASVVIDGLARTFPAVVSDDRVQLTDRGALFSFTAGAAETAAAAEQEVPQLVSPMPGGVVLVPVTDGAEVAAGDPVVVVEAMKMEHVVKAPAAGTVTVHVRIGDHVERGQVVAEIEDHGNAEDHGKRGEDRE